MCTHLLPLLRSALLESAVVTSALLLARAAQARAVLSASCGQIGRLVNDYLQLQKLMWRFKKIVRIEIATMGHLDGLFLE